MGRRNAKPKKRQGDSTLQICSKRKKSEKEETNEGSTFDEATVSYCPLECYGPKRKFLLYSIPLYSIFELLPADTEDLTLSSHRKQLVELADKDPEFYKFLKEQESDLLNFDESDSDVEEDSYHEVDSEGEKSEENEDLQRDSTGRKVIDLDFVTNLRDLILQKDRLELPVIHRMVAAFKACVARVGADVEPPSYVINDSDVFESVVRLCFTYLGKSLLSLIGHIKTEADNDEPDPKFEKVRKYTNKQYRCWKKHSNLIKSYLHALLQFLNEIQTSSVTVCTLRAVTDLLDLYVHFPKLIRNLTKIIIKIWSRRTDECRIAAFLALSKLIRIQKSSFPAMIKRCYLEYVMNVRDVKAESWPLIVLMQKSFAELCMTFPEVAYQYAFVYVRQTAIHLRNAMIAKRKDLIQTIYNWQFVQCLYLWSQVIAKAHRYTSNKKEDAAGIKELDYPLCQITVSAMKLFPSLKYFPLRLHCLRILLIIQQNCHTYIPTLSLAVELLSDALLMLKKKPMKGKGTQKNIDMRCMLKVSAAHVDDAGFRQAALEELFRIHLEAAHIVQQSCAFPDIIIPINHEIKAFVRNCCSTEFSRLFKSLETKLQEQAVYAKGILNSTDVDLTNVALVEVTMLGKMILFVEEHLQKHLERRFQAPDAPLTKFYDSWQKIWKIREDVRDLMNTKPVQQPFRTNSEQNVTAAIKTKSTVVVKPDKIKKNSAKQERRELERSTLANEDDEDVLEDLLLSDAED
uniref:Nucleolar complex protein 2 homolog n=1 Tax=Elaeophora elaphi TaxID=1147741 RepID=A0A0R3RXZ6_9BILA